MEKDDELSLPSSITDQDIEGWIESIDKPPAERTTEISTETLEEEKDDEIIDDADRFLENIGFGELGDDNSLASDFDIASLLQGQPQEEQLQEEQPPAQEITRTRDTRPAWFGITPEGDLYEDEEEEEEERARRLARERARERELEREVGDGGEETRRTGEVDEGEIDPFTLHFLDEIPPANLPPAAKMRSEQRKKINKERQRRRRLGQITDAEAAPLPADEPYERDETRTKYLFLDQHFTSPYEPDKYLLYFLQNENNNPREIGRKFVFSVRYPTVEDPDALITGSLCAKSAAHKFKLFVEFFGEDGSIYYYELTPEDKEQLLQKSKILYVLHPITNKGVFSSDFINGEDFRQIHWIVADASHQFVDAENSTNLCLVYFIPEEIIAWRELSYGDRPIGPHDRVKWYYNERQPPQAPLEDHNPESDQYALPNVYTQDPHKLSVVDHILGAVRPGRDRNEYLQELYQPPRENVYAVDGDETTITPTENPQLDCPSAAELRRMRARSGLLRGSRGGTYYITRDGEKKYCGLTSLYGMGPRLHTGKRPVGKLLKMALEPTPRNSKKDPQNPRGNSKSCPLKAKPGELQQGPRGGMYQLYLKKTCKRKIVLDPTKEAVYLIDPNCWKARYCGTYGYPNKTRTSTTPTHLPNEVRGNREERGEEGEGEGELEQIEEEREEGRGGEREETVGGEEEEYAEDDETPLTRPSRRTSQRTRTSESTEELEQTEASQKETEDLYNPDLSNIPAFLS